MNEVYRMVRRFKRKFPRTIAFRTSAHASVVEEHLNPGEKVSYAFCAQKNISSFMIINSCVIAITNKRILYNDLKVTKNLIWSDIEIDTAKENVYISNIDPKGAIEIETKITEFMMNEKKKYGKGN